MTKVKIEDDVPLPGSEGGKKTTKGKAGSGLPFAELKAGQSFAVPARTKQIVSTIRSRAVYYGRKLGVSFRCAYDAEGHQARVWRTK